jgi:threonine/homoserine/homoserine lactone efflux protein
LAVAALLLASSVTFVIPATHLLAFAAVAIVIIAIPGPSVLFTISRALTVGRRAALLTVAGNELGLCAQVAAVAFGLGSLLERAAAVLTIVKWSGAAYLCLLGVQAIRHRRSLAAALAERCTPVRPLRAVRDGVIVGATGRKELTRRPPCRFRAVQNGHRRSSSGYSKPEGKT